MTVLETCQMFMTYQNQFIFVITVFVPRHDPSYKIYDPNIVSLPETSSSGSSSYIDSGSYNYDYSDYSYYDENFSWGSYRPLRALASLNEVDATFQCRPLTVFNSMFWDGLSDEQEGWHAAWQAAAALGAIGTAIGAITLVVLLKSVCFTMPKKSVRDKRNRAFTFSRILMFHSWNYCAGALHDTR
mmetsp:Transcript_17625/g.35561  ORF Transcript_17625/g.35561 Transcript_17625/m.35561 type:complete len:186 (-) Transcript_17625:673-1230(-)